jgi:hypothetical protein
MAIDPTGEEPVPVVTGNATLDFNIHKMDKLIEKGKTAIANLDTKLREFKEKATASRDLPDKEREKILKVPRRKMKIAEGDADKIGRKLKGAVRYLDGEEEKLADKVGKEKAAEALGPAKERVGTPLGKIEGLLRRNVKEKKWTPKNPPRGGGGGGIGGGPGTLVAITSVLTTIAEHGLSTKTAKTLLTAYGVGKLAAVGTEALICRTATRSLGTVGLFSALRSDNAKFSEYQEQYEAEQELNESINERAAAIWDRSPGMTFLEARESVIGHILEEQGRQAANTQKFWRLVTGDPWY